MSQTGRPLLSNIYSQNAYFSGNGVRTSLVAMVLKAFPIQRTHERQDETFGEDVFYTVWLSVIRNRADKIRESVESRNQFSGERRRRLTEESKVKFMCCKIVKRLTIILPGEYSR
jgi:hypothetical protein